MILNSRCATELCSQASISCLRSLSDLLTDTGQERLKPLFPQDPRILPVPIESLLDSALLKLQLTIANVYSQPFCCCKTRASRVFSCICVHSCFQLTLTIVRQTGGLGISIAGGKGSTPYKGDDEVSSRHPVTSLQSPVSLSPLLRTPATLVSGDGLLISIL